MTYYFIEITERSLHYYLNLIGAEGFVAGTRPGDGGEADGGAESLEESFKCHGFQCQVTEVKSRKSKVKEEVAGLHAGKLAGGRGGHGQAPPVPHVGLKGTRSGV